MLDEGRRRRERGQDVVVGAVQPSVGPDIQQAISTLEVIPFDYSNGVPVMDLPRILERHPKVCLVDGLAYDNPPGTQHGKRWQDVEALLDAGISVISSINLQHIKEKSEQVEAITGKHVSETVPLSFLNTADEIVLVDVSPEASMGVTSDGASNTLQKLSRQQLSGLREIALLLAADVVDKQLERYMASHGLEQLWGTRERILVYLSPKSDARRMIDSGARNRDRFHGDLIVCHLNRPEWSPEQRRKVEEGLRYADQNRAELAELAGEDAADTIMRFARRRGITQIYVGQKGHERWWDRLFGNDLDRLIRAAEGIDVRVFPHS